MRTQNIQFASSGDQIASDQILIKNVTAADFVAYGVYAFDLDKADTDTTDEAKSLYHAVPVSATNINGILVVVGPKAIKVGESGQAYVSGKVKVRVNGAILATDTLKAVAGQSYLTASTTGTSSVGRALGLQASGTNTMTALFDGWAFKRHTP